LTDLFENSFASEAPHQHHQQQHLFDVVVVVVVAVVHNQLLAETSRAEKED
jgi:hypothetical protein